MKVTVRDSETLKTIEPSQLAAYLQTHGWYEDGSFLDNATIWLYKKDDVDEFEILLPNLKSLGDYAARMSDALSTLEVVEKRSQLDILSDLLTSASNIEIQGMVIEIEEFNSTGIVTLMGVVVGKLRRINVELRQPEYNLAIKAYEQRLPVICTGDLIKKDSFFVLNNPRNFAILNAAIR
ncbi:hypothetical protein H6S82_03040 [Planktothrix sp. FACHB-1355]|uniref:Uncharacterized protein n=1 Tax=Aerosakkonema funiforme FACHB-1375 TaxID=2949571 RepID=A0A926VHY8_9CYAN|nr:MULTISPECIES: hypothetical protein [Oscillatoriales]MBD2184114.1 hypothetical protein [Aerosakkonema funiforme FACHB-1375]MBD3557832.1 hypothetical protein [Planktothrix sp. FACHB-1355]